nr:AraC family transcriptional regulator [Rhodococcus sp. HNM0569]
MERLNDAIDVLEAALARGEEPDLSRAYRVSGTSEHHFRRMFASLAGMPISVYVRRRRLTLAARDVVDGDMSLLDVAVRHGYGSTEAFNRAFRSVHGVTAGQARREDTRLVSQPRISFQLVVEGSTSMQYRIVRKEGFSIVGRKTRVPLVHVGPNDAIVEFERSLDPEVRAVVSSLSDQEPHGAVAVTDAVDDSRAEGTELDYWHAAATWASAPEGLDTLEVPAGTWVVFTTSGRYPEAMQNMWRDAYGDWFPSNPWRTRPGPEMLRTTFVDEGHAEAELWLPVEADGSPE